MSQHPSHSVPERALIVAAQRGDRAAFRAIYEAEHQRVYNLVYYMLEDSRVIEDAVQTVFMKVLCGLPNFRFEADLSTWIYQIAINECHNQNRRQQQRHVSFESLLGSNEEVDGQPLPEIQHALSERQEIIREAVLNLSPKLREVIILKYVEGLSYEEIAGVLDCATGTVASRLNRALARLELHLRPLRGLL